MVTGHSVRLPGEIREAMIETFREVSDNEPDVRIDNVRGNDADGYQFDYRSGEYSGTAYSFRHKDKLFLAPKPIMIEVLDAATDAMRTCFDEDWVPDLHSEGRPEKEIQRMRESIVPCCCLFPHSPRDPYGLIETYDVVFQMTNPLRSDHVYFVGIDLDDLASHQAYTFN